MKLFSTPDAEFIAMRMDVTGFTTFVGVDLHEASITLRAVRADGELLGHLTCSTKAIERIDKWVTELPGPRWMAVKACPFVEWFIDRYTPCVDRMDIADPQLMQLRKLGRHRRRMSHMPSKVKHYMKSMLNAANIRGPQFDGARAQKWFFAFGYLLNPAQRDTFCDYLELLMPLERRRETPRRKILTADRSAMFSGTMAILISVPGIGPIWALTIAMTADLKESAGRTQSGSISKSGSATLRWALCQAAVTPCQSDACQEATRQWFIARMPQAKANVVMGRRLLRTLYAMVRDQKPYQCGERRDRAKAANQAKAKRTPRALQPA